METVAGMTVRVRPPAVCGLPEPRLACTSRASGAAWSLISASQASRPAEPSNSFKYTWPNWLVTCSAATLVQTCSRSSTSADWRDTRELSSRDCFCCGNSTRAKLHQITTTEPDTMMRSEEHTSELQS